MFLNDKYTKKCQWSYWISNLFGILLLVKFLSIQFCFQFSWLRKYRKLICGSFSLEQTADTYEDYDSQVLPKTWNSSFSTIQRFNLIFAHTIPVKIMTLQKSQFLPDHADTPSWQPWLALNIVQNCDVRAVSHSYNVY